MQTDTEILSTFFAEIYAKQSGSVVLATKVPNSKIFTRTYYQWPSQASELVTDTLSQRTSTEVYFTPALFDGQGSTMEHITGASCFWVELDKPPKELANIPQPTIRVQTSTGKEHWYWQLDGVATKDRLNKVNKSLTYILGADISGWDATQILRPPCTLNHKYVSESSPEPFPVAFLSLSGERYGVEAFDWLPEPPIAPPSVTVLLENVPSLEQIIFKYQLNEYTTKLFTTGQTNAGDRSSALMQLGYELAKAKMTTEDALCMLLHADNRWGKFSKRDDQLKQLLHIISVAHAKYPVIGVTDNGKLTNKSLGFSDLLYIERNVEWVMEGLLELNGNALITGQPGIGKTQFSLQAAAHIALGRDFLGFACAEPRKVMFLSLEMDDVALKDFTRKQATQYSQEDLKLLNENFRIVPLGQPLYLNYKAQQDLLLEMMLEEGIQGVFIDSLSRAMDGPLQDEVATRNLMGWVDTIRNSHSIFTWFIHHNRKASGDNKKPKFLADIYGSVFITSALTSAFVLWATGTKNEIELSFVKSRQSEDKDAFNILRDKNLNFHRKTPHISVVREYENPEPPEDNLANFTSFRSTFRKLPSI